jgi:hypothetical protein
LSLSDIEIEEIDGIEGNEGIVAPSIFGAQRPNLNPINPIIPIIPFN